MIKNFSRLLLLIFCIVVMASTMIGCNSEKKPSESVLTDTSEDTSLIDSSENSESNEDTGSTDSNESTESTGNTNSTKYTGRYTLVNKDSDEITQRVYDYVCDNYGVNMLTCQQESTWMGTPA